jgi:hypothetical protein
MRGRLRWCVILGALAVVSPRGAAQEPAQSKEVLQAIERGSLHLKKMQAADGRWPHEHTGSTPLVAWTLLECGVSPNDPCIQKAADYTRRIVLRVPATYTIAVTLLFLDRLGDPEDEPLIQLLALQLMMGQNKSNGWTYLCPLPPSKEVERVKEHVEQLLKAGPRQLPEKAAAGKAPRDKTKVHPAVLAAAQAIDSEPAALLDLAPLSDNSNTQFAMLALWVARRHGMPVDKALLRVEQRFRGTQQNSGGWGYSPRVAQASDKPMFLPPSMKAKATMTAVGLLSLAIGQGVVPKDGRKVDLNIDPLVKSGLIVLSASVGEAGQPKDSLVLPRDSKTYFFLWTLERLAVVYGLQTIAGKDWHRWGVELLLANQKDDGSWEGEYGNSGYDTCFALLFLAKANSAGDLTVKLKDQVKDPGKVAEELLERIGREVQPGLDKPLPPKKNAPVPEMPPSQPLSRDLHGFWNNTCGQASHGLMSCLMKL